MDMELKGTKVDWERFEQLKGIDGLHIVRPYSSVLLIILYLIHLMNHAGNATVNVR